MCLIQYCDCKLFLMSHYLIMFLMPNEIVEFLNIILFIKLFCFGHASCYVIFLFENLYKHLDHPIWTRLIFYISFLLLL
jgi:hypothetical protein